MSGQVQREGAPPADGARDPDLASEQPRDLPADRQAQPRAAVPPRAAHVDLLEGLEDEAPLVLRDADPRVDDRERHDRVGLVEHLVVAAPAGRGRLHPQDDLTLLGELQRVGQEVLEDLVEALLIGGHGLGQAVARLDAEPEALLLRDLAEGPLDELPHFVEGEFADLDQYGPGFDLGHVEDVADQG